MPAFPTLDPATRLERLEPPAAPPSIVLDTDAYNEIDDQFAIAYALESALDVEAIYAAPFHNDRSEGPGDGMERSYAEIERVLGRLGRDAGIAFRGSDSYLPAADEPVASPAVDDLIARAEGGDPRYVVAIGAPTNVASALLAAPSLVEEIVVVWLGGHPHDWPTAREFNLRQDRHASRILLDSGVPLVQIPCKNVAEHVRTTMPELEAHLAGRGEIADYLVENVAAYGTGEPGWSTVIWDVATIAYLLDPDRVPTDVVHSPHLSEALRWSRDTGRHFIRVATDADRDAILRDLFATL